MFKGLTSCLAIAVLVVGAQVASAQCGGGHGCRISNAFNGLVGNAFGGANCGREISQHDAQALWAGYCTDDCSINSGCGGGCGGGCGAAPVYAAPIGNYGGDVCGCGGGCAAGHGCLGGKLRNLFGALRGGGGGGNCFGYPTGGCGNNCGCGSCGGAVVHSGGHFGGDACGCGGGSACGGGCGGRLLGKLKGLFHGGCGCRLFSRGNWHDRTFSTFYANHASASTSYFGGYVGPETGFGDFTSAVNGQITGCCGSGNVVPGSVMQPTAVSPRPVQGREVSPVMPGEVQPNVGDANHNN